MTRVEILRCGGKIIGFAATGHSGYAKSGRDIVCSAVSALTQSAVYGLTQIASLPAQTHTGDDELSCRIGQDLSGEGRLKADVILETMLAGLLAIEAGYPKNLRITQREV